MREKRTTEVLKKLLTYVGRTEYQAVFRALAEREPYVALAVLASRKARRFLRLEDLAVLIQSPEADLRLRVIRASAQLGLERLSGQAA